MIGLCPCAQAPGDECIDLGKIGADIAFTIHGERRIPSKPSQERLEEALNRCRVNQPQRDSVAELRRKGLRPLRERMEVILKLLGKPGVHHVLLDLVP